MGLMRSVFFHYVLFVLEDVGSWQSSVKQTERLTKENIVY